MGLLTQNPPTLMAFEAPSHWSFDPDRDTGITRTVGDEA